MSSSSQQNLLLSKISTSSFKQQQQEHKVNQRDKDTIKLLTFNTWGLKKVSKFRNERFENIIDLLSGKPSSNLEHPIPSLSTDSDFDIIALQEIWCENNRNDLIAKLRKNKNFNSRFFSSGIITGPGLGLLTKFDIKKSWLYRFPVNGVPWAVHRGDFYVGKSLAITEVNVSNNKNSNGEEKNDSLVILNSHMHAPYAQSGYNAYLCHRVVQAYDIYKVVTLLQETGKRVVLVGDLNSKPGSLPHRIMTSLTGLVDSFVSEQIYTPEQIAAMTCEEQVLLAGTTCDSQLNTWRAEREHWEACRLDYALIDPKKLRCVESKVQMTEVVPGIGSLSDHFGYSCVLKMEASDPRLIIETSSKEKEHILKEIVTVIDDYVLVAKKQRFVRLAHFAISVIIILASIIFITFTSRISGWSSVIVYIGGVVILVTGLLNGIFGYVFAQSELRGLNEVRMEVLDDLNSL
ncbi:hypothetical protein ACO0SA_002545 [Hanseniaspora valbyensis]